MRIYRIDPGKHESTQYIVIRTLQARHLPRAVLTLITLNAQRAVPTEDGATDEIRASAGVWPPCCQELFEQQLQRRVVFSH